MHDSLHKKVITGLLAVTIFSTLNIRASANSLDIKLFVNNKEITNQKNIKLPAHSLVSYAVYSTAARSIKIDFNGSGQLQQFNSFPITYSTVYNPGDYTVIFTANNKSKYLNISVQKDFIDWQVFLSNLSNFLINIAWPLAILLILFRFLDKKSINKLINSIRTLTVPIGSKEISIEILRKNLDDQFNDIQKQLEEIFPQERAQQFILWSLKQEKDIIQYIYKAEFLNELGIDQPVYILNVIGNYYFNIEPTKSFYFYQLAYAKDAGNTSTLANLGFWYYRTAKNFTQAEKYLDKVKQLVKEKKVNKDVSYAWTCAIFCLLYKRFKDSETEEDKQKIYQEEIENNLQEAKSILKHTIDKNPKDYWSHYMLGWCYARGKNPDYQKAIEYTEEALAIQENHVISRYNLAYYEAHENRSQESVAELKKLFLPVKEIFEFFDFKNDKFFEKIKDKSEFKKLLDVLDLN